MMCGTQLWLLALLAFPCLTSWADGAPLEVMSAPNLLRVGTAENIFVEVQESTEEKNITVEITVWNHPTKSKLLASTSVYLTKEKNFQEIGQITIPTKDFSKDPNMKQYVHLQAKFPDQELEKVVLVSFHCGYIFIQTDKTIYTPNGNVLFRVFAVRPGMEPVERNSQMDSSITIEIVNPDNIVVRKELVSLKSEIYSGNYELGEIVSPGLWKVVAKFYSNPQQGYSAAFEVKEYVLPSFEVKLTSLSSFFHVDSEELTIDIKATYLFGEEVDGAAYVIFGVKQEHQKRSLPHSLQRVPIEGGKGAVKLQKKHITQTFQSISELVGTSIYVAVSVLTESGSEMVETELRGIKIVTSPYTIQFKKTPRYFKPGMTFDVAVEVLNPDETPAKNVAVLVDPGAVRSSTANNGIAKLTLNTEEGIQTLTITARTDDNNILLEKQASSTMTAEPYTTESNNYIHIGVDRAELKLGEKLKINLYLSRQTKEKNDITYLILSRGQLVKFGHYQMKRQVMISIMESITKDMLPSFRIIAYYRPSDNEVVSDSVWLDVENSCMGSLKLEPLRTDPSYEPRKKFALKVTGDPGAKVGLVAVDKGIYVLNNKHRLTQEKVWDSVEKYDTGCTPGGGKDSMSVFYDAGLLFESNLASGTPYRKDLKCTAPSRRKRASTIMDVRTSLTSQYEDELQRDCCLDGMTDTPLLYTCERRSEYITDGAPCTEAFLHCCNVMKSQRDEKKEESLRLARSEEDDSYMDSNDIVSRTSFPASWLWSDITLPVCPEETPKCTTTFDVNQNLPLPDSITTWQFTGISLSKTHGICVADSLEVIVRKIFFIDLRLPYSAVRGEQLEVKAILHNYLPDPVTVRVELIDNQNLCSSASKRGKYSQEVYVGSQTTRSVPFIIIPMMHGKFPIEVKAAVKGSWFNDGIRKDLLVVPEGVQKKYPMIITLDPAKKGVGGKQEEIINSGIPRSDMIPNTPTSTLISLIGREHVAPLVENAINGTSMGTLIYEPTGCGEQNMFHMTLPVIATMYLDKTNQWEAVGFQKRQEALKHITKGFQNELAYRRTDGSFAAFSFSNSSTWLTAYVAKVFAMAYSLVDLQKSVICDAVKFLILKTQDQSDGMFREIGQVFRISMTGDVQGKESDASLTAFCLIAMQESKTICADSVSSLSDSISKSVAYLEERLPSLTYPYAVAMTSYALANENKLNREILYNFVSPDLSHWPVSSSRVLTRESTAYALLALMKAKLFEDARPVVRWFNKQHNKDGGYGSTQATIMVYQALADYWANAEEPEYDLNVNIAIQGRSLVDKYNLKKENQFTTKTSQFNNINKDVKVTATGKGEATLTMVSLYYALPQEQESNCEKFNLTVELQEEKMDENENIYKMRIEVLYKNPQRNGIMTIVDIGLPTGFTPNTNDLSLLSKGHARTISKYEMDKVLSERGSLIIYLDKVSNSHPEQIAFRIHQKMKVGVLQPAAVSVYEYDDRTHCVKFYHPQRSGELLRLCTEKECTCADENCSMQRKGNIKNEDRTEKVCESTQTSKIDFVYKVRVENFTGGLTTDSYTMRIMDVIKQGNLDAGPQGNQRSFLSAAHCRKALDLVTGKTYLIMGTARDIYRDDKYQTYMYVLGETTWIEYWPTGAECQSDTHRITCLGMEEMVSRYTVFGCQQ